VSEEGGAAPTPWVLDVSVLIAVARADAEVTGLILELDARGQPLVLSALAMAAASLDARTSDADDALRGLERLDNVEVAALRDAEQAARLAAVIARTGLDAWDAPCGRSRRCGGLPHPHPGRGEVARACGRS
jgi:predicted nucleic acid-binding protein